MTSPATKSVCPSANRYHGRRSRGASVRAAIRIATGEDSAMALKTGPTLRGPTNSQTASRAYPARRWESQALRLMLGLSVGGSPDFRATDYRDSGIFVAGEGRRDGGSSVPAGPRSGGRGPRRGPVRRIDLSAVRLAPGAHREGLDVAQPGQEQEREGHDRADHACADQGGAVADQSVDHARHRERDRQKGVGDEPVQARDPPE